MLNEFISRREDEIKFLLILMGGLALLLSVSYILGQRVDRGDNSTPTILAPKYFPEVALQAKAAYVYDARTNTVFFAKNENTRMPLASLTKVMSALVASESSYESDMVLVTEEALRRMGDSGLKSGERWSLRDLLDFSLVSSSNDGIAAVALALGTSRDFVQRMNAKAGELDLKNTYFWNETGLDESDVKGGAYGTAKDMAHLLSYTLAYHPELLAATREVSVDVLSLDDLIHKAENTNDVAGEIPGLLASKTGFTDTAGGNLVFAFDPELGRPIIVTILGSSQEGRFEDAKKLVEATLLYLNGGEK